MDTLIFIGLLGVFSYHCLAIGKEFRGSSETARSIASFLGAIGYTAYLVVFVWSFWHFPWWQPIVTFIAAIIVGGVTAIIFQRTVMGIIISLICVVVFAILSIIGLIG